MKTGLEPWRTNLEPWNTIKTIINHWKPTKTEMEPWKTNLEPSKLTRSCRGWLWVVQVVTGNSQEEVMIFHDRHTYTSSWYISSSTSLSWPSERGDCSFIAQSLITPSSPDQDWLPGERSLAQNCFSLLDFQIFKLSIKESHLSALKEKHSKMDPIFRQFFSSQNFVVQKIISNRWIKTNINASNWLT